MRNMPDQMQMVHGDSDVGTTVSSLPPFADVPNASLQSMEATDLVISEIRDAHRRLEERVTHCFEASNRLWKAEFQELQLLIKTHDFTSMDESAFVGGPLDAVDEEASLDDSDEGRISRASGSSSPNRSSSPGGGRCSSAASQDLGLCFSKRSNRTHISETASTFAFEKTGSGPATGGPFRDLHKAMPKEITIFEHLHETFGFGLLKDIQKYRRSIHDRFGDAHLDNYCSKIVNSTTFSVTVGAMIIGNAILVAVDGHYNLTAAILDYENGVQQGDKRKREKWFELLGIFFTVFFALELLLRAMSDGLKLFCGRDAYWNIFDTTIVLVSFLSFVSESVMNMSYARLFRVLRLTRALRTVRVLKYFQETRVMLSAVLCSFVPLFWSVSFVILVMFLFDVFLMFAVSEYVDRQDPLAPESPGMEKVREFFKSFQMILLSLFMSVSGGVDWWILGRWLIHDSLFYGLVFIFYVALMLLGLMNIITGVFVTATSDMTKIDRETAAMNETAKRVKTVRSLKVIFEEMDEDGSGDVTWDEFEKHLEREDVKGYLSALDINISRAKALFKLLDVNESASISVDEFVMGCLRLKGAAKTVDVGTLMYETRALKQMFLKQGAVIAETLVQFELALQSQTYAMQQTLGRVHGQLARSLTKSISALRTPHGSLNNKQPLTVSIKKGASFEGSSFEL